MKTILTYIAINILLIAAYLLLVMMCFKPAFSDDMRGVGIFITLCVVHVIFCFLAGIVMDMRGNSPKAKMFFISAATPFLLALIGWGFAVIGF